MRKIFFLMFALEFGNFIKAQDTVRIETVRVDTVKVETVKTDSVHIQPVNKSKSTVVQAESKEQPLEKKKFNPGKMYFGGYANLSFGKYTVIGAEPLVGYKLTSKLSVGSKFSYEHVSDKRYQDDYSYSNYGFSVFSRFRLTQRIYAHAEFSEMNYQLYYSSGDNNRKWVPFLYLGGGYSQPVTKNTWVTAEVLFDVLQNENSRYKKWSLFLV